MQPVSGAKTILLFDKRQFGGASVAASLSRVLPHFNIEHVVASHLVSSADSVCLILASIDAFASPAELIQEVETLQSLVKNAPAALFGTLSDRAIAQAYALRGFRGTVPDTASDDVVAAATLLIVAGQTYFPQDFAINAAEANNWGNAPFKQNGRGFEIATSLTAKELEVLGELVKGQSNKTIAGNLNIKENTVKIHIRNLLKKLGVSNRTEAVVVAQKHRLIN
ncbi:hypothetical protein BH10PSE7_BH10PSE7_12750 [soil metagenome]